MSKKPIPVLSFGMGVESAAILFRWILEIASRNFDLSELIVITSQTGDEYLNTKTLVETYILPLLRKHKIRFVEVARAGHLEEEGIVVIQDTREPYEVHIDGTYPGGTYYKLSDELKRFGTVPQFGGEHRCAMKFKAFVIESWLSTNVYNTCIKHAFGYNADEKSRVENSEKGIAQRNAALLTFGFNSKEGSRIERSEEYDNELRVGHYPLMEWGWSREACLQYIKEKIGAKWEKSACVYCPFNALKEDGIQRLCDHPEQAADGVMVEHLSLSMNPRGHLYAKGALIDLVKSNDMTKILKLHEKNLSKGEWALYRVRRVYSKKGKADRCVQKMETGSRDAMGIKLIKASNSMKLELVEQRGIFYAYMRQRAKDVYPAVEEFYVAAPAIVENKVRYTMERFEQIWRAALGGKIWRPEAKPKAQRISSEVNDPAEMKAIFEAYRENGGDLTFQQIELVKKFRLKKANGMTAYRIIKRYETMQLATV